MYVPQMQILPTNISKLRPTKRKIVKTTYTAEKCANGVLPQIPKETRPLVKWFADMCKNARQRMTKPN